MPSKLVAGRGQYVDDVVLPRMVHVAFVRSPHAHARIVAIDAQRGAEAAGRAARVHRARLAAHCEPWVATLAHLKGMKSAPQLPLPLERATWVGEPVAAVVAESRAEAEDAAEQRARRLGAAARRRRHGDRARCPTRPSSIPSSATTSCFQRVNETGNVDDAFAGRAQVVEDTFHIGRHTGRHASSRARSWPTTTALRPSSPSITPRQAPHMMQGVFAKHLRLPEGDVRVICTRRRRQLRHQGARLPRRGGGRRHRQDAGPAGQVHRRPAGELRHRHPRARPSHQGAHGRRRRRAASSPSTSTT